MPLSTSNNELSDLGAKAIREAFITYRTRFREITRRAQSRFIDRDWQAMRTDAARRLELYREAVDRIEIDIRQLMANRVQDKRIWADIKTAYSARLFSNDDWELAETFFNSTTRRIFPPWELIQILNL
jgi:isocitrate dehydrogenase kinase/phosphatase